MEKRRCAACRKTFKPDRRVPDQHFCADPACQKERRRRAQKQKRRTDADYRENDRSAQRTWRTQNPGYQKNYRETHPGYTEENRLAQRARDKRRRGAAAGDVATTALLVNEDVSMPISPDVSATYVLNPGNKSVLVNEDSMTVKFRVLSVP